jgi:hypothetical protein
MESKLYNLCRSRFQIWLVAYSFRQFQPSAFKPRIQWKMSSELQVGLVDYASRYSCIFPRQVLNFMQILSLRAPFAKLPRSYFRPYTLTRFAFQL